MIKNFNLLFIYLFFKERPSGHMYGQPANSKSKKNRADHQSEVQLLSLILDPTPLETTLSVLQC